MSKYTITLNALLKDPLINPLIEKALSTYPIYEAKSKNEYIPNIIPTRSELNKKILNHYKYREIAFDTVGRFLDELEISMNEIMPYYNQLMFTQDQDFNIIFNVDYQRTIDITKDGNTDNTANEVVSTSSSGETTSSATDRTTTSADIENNNKNIKSSTPQNLLDIGTKNISEVNYADEASWNHDLNSDSGVSEGTSNANTTNSLTGTSSNEVISNTKNNESEKHLETTKGNFGVVSSQDLIMKYRETILNIEKMIIEDMRIKELFMMIY